MQRDTQPPTASQERDSLVEGISMKGNPQRSERNGNRELAYYPAQPGRNEAPYITLSIDGQYTEKTSEIFQPKEITNLAERIENDAYMLLLAERAGDDSFPDWDTDFVAPREKGRRKRSEHLLMINGGVYLQGMERTFAVRDAVRDRLAEQILRELDEHSFEDMQDSEKEALKQAVKKYTDEKKCSSSFGFDTI